MKYPQYHYPSVPFWHQCWRVRYSEASWLGQCQTPPFVTGNLFQRGLPCPPIHLRSLFNWYTSPVLWKEFFRFTGVWDGFRYKWGSSTFDRFSDIQSCDCRKGWVEHSRSLLMNGSYWCSRTSTLSFLKSRLKAFLNWWSICSASINFAIADPAPALSQGSAALNHSKLRSKKMGQLWYLYTTIVPLFWIFWGKGSWSVSLAGRGPTINLTDITRQNCQLAETQGLQRRPLCFSKYQNFSCLVE